MAYTFLDERAFAAAGGEEREGVCYSPCITEDQGKIVTVFPLSHRLEEALERIPFGEVLETLGAHLPAREEQVVSVFPRRIRGEGEESPDLFYHRLLEELSGAASRFEFTLPGRVFRSLKAPGKLYFPSSIGRGEAYGHLPRAALTNSPEAKGIYSKMMCTSLLINQLRGDKARKHAAREELWKAQGGDLFEPPAPPTSPPPPGGASPSRAIARGVLRKAAYRSLLEAEKVSRGKGDFSPSLSGFDFDFDGRIEYLFQGSPLNCYVQTGGASVFELDYLPRSWNYLDTLSTEESGGALERRTAFADYLLPPQGEEGEGRFCGAERFEAAAMDRAEGTVCFRLPLVPGEPFGMVELEKTYQLKGDTLRARYALHNRGNDPETFVLSPRLDFSFPGEGADCLALAKRPQNPPFQEGSFEAAGVLELQDLRNEVLISLEASQSFGGRVFPVYGGETGEAYQSTCILPRFPFHLEPGEDARLELRLRLSPLHNPGIPEEDREAACK
jgi:hypothetical protein